MFFVLSKVFWALAQPLTLCVMLLVAGLVLLALGRRKPAIATLGLGTGIIVLLGFTTTGSVMLGPLEDRFSRPAQPPTEVVAIVVLGGGFDAQVSGARHNEELNAGGDRFVEAVRLARIYPQAKVLITGGYGTLTQDGDTDAVIAERFYKAFGIGPDRLMLEGQSRNTEENAQLTRDMLKPAPGETVLLVTSAFHMPRSMGLFRAAGMDVTAWPTDYRTTGTRALSLDWGDSAGNLSMATIAFKEWIGLATYKLTGKIADWFPAP